MAGTDPRCVIDVRDPWSRRIRCYRERWDGHIVPGHSEMAGHYWQEAVIRAIEQPFLVTSDPEKMDFRHYYGAGAWPSEPYIAKVVVKYLKMPPKRGIVITAYSTIEPPPNEIVVWRK